ncbi:MAG: SGNH/GDSL hydrolase family protein [Clostridia bacterium]|nr:SGNH/GDSL hydrolase family protein [Clostridia bacterium]NCC68592.1 SGNH/GDSL hydrolase family protein [Clostridia bacterium]
MNQNRKNTMYIFWSGAIVICLGLVLFALLFSSCTKGGEAAASPTPSESTEPSDNVESGGTDSGETPAPTEPVAAAYTCELSETEDAGWDYIDKLTFLGDSTTHGLVYYGVLSDNEDTTQVWTPASGTLTLSRQSIDTIVYPETGEEITIVAAVTEKKPEYLVITLGVNGVSFMNEEYFTAEYTALVQSIQDASPNTKIICNSIYPVADDYENLESINNEKITAANGWIKNVAEATGVKYADSAPEITGSDGFLLQEYCNGDGIHLNSAGYLKILDYLRTHAYQ